MKFYVTANFSEEGLDILRRHGEVVYEPWGETGRLLVAEELAEKVAALAVDILVIEVDLVHEEVFEARKLRAVACCRADPLIVDMDCAGENGVPVFFTPGRNAHSVAELAVAHMLNCARGIIPIHNRLTTGGFDPSDVKELMDDLNALAGFELGGATVGLVGLGAVGFQTARLLAAFGSRLLVYDPYAPQARLDEVGARRASLEELFGESDIVSMHCAVTNETKRMVNADLIGRMKPTAYFVNTARSQLVDLDALYAALKDKKIAGAALDVFKTEPVTPDDPYLKLENVIATPHIGGATKDVIRRQSLMAAGDVDRLLRGEKPIHCANPEVLK